MGYQISCSPNHWSRVVFWKKKKKSCILSDTPSYKFSGNNGSGMNRVTKMDKYK